MKVIIRIINELGRVVILLLGISYAYLFLVLGFVAFPHIIVWADTQRGNPIVTGVLHTDVVLNVFNNLTTGLMPLFVLLTTIALSVYVAYKICRIVQSRYSRGI